MSTTMSSPEVDRLLAAYPHVAQCPRCREYAAEYLADNPPMQVLAAALDHHDSAHSSDRLGRTASLF
jgi:hypothetical protein